MREGEALPTSDPEPTVLDLPEGRLAYVDEGPRDAPALIAVHGIPGSALLAYARDDHMVETRVSEELAAALPAARVLAFDEGGHNIQKTRAVELGQALREWLGAGALLGFALLATSCVPSPGPGAPELRILRLGPERTEVPYDDPRRADKEVLLERINQDRATHGASPVRYEPRAALAGDLFCLDAALAGSWGHWDPQGRGPYLRWGLAGGVDFHSENTASYSVSDGRVRRPVADLLLEVHEEMMAETPPEDGHRRTILDPGFTHVGIGVAVVGGEFRMSQEFTRAVFEWIEVPDRPLRAGQHARFAGRPPPGWEVAIVEVRFEPPPRPLSLSELKARGSYRYPPVWRTLRPRPPWDSLVAGGDRGDFQADRGQVEVTFPLEAGPGHYFVLCYLRPKRGGSESLSPATAALITALP